MRIQNILASYALAEANTPNLVELNKSKQKQYVYEFPLQRIRPTIDYQRTLTKVPSVCLPMRAIKAKLFCFPVM